MAKRRKKKAKRKKTTKRKTKSTRKKTSKAKKRKTKKKTKARKTKTRRTKAKKTKKKTKRKPNAAFMSPMQPSDALAEVIGKRPLPRTQVVKRVWQYIKSHHLQDPKNRRNVRADAKLKKVFKGKSVVTMFQLTKLLNKNLKKAA